jgi:Spx/MgsR family transcriptional regulator
MWKVYGITRCTTVQKTLTWLDTHGVVATLHDFKKDGLPEADLLRWMNERGWEKILNRASLTWRHFSDEDKLAVIDAQSALVLARKNPSVIRRPLLVRDAELVDIGFNEKRYEQTFES